MGESGCIFFGESELVRGLGQNLRLVIDRTEEDNERAAAVAALRISDA